MLSLHCCFRESACVVLAALSCLLSTGHSLAQGTVMFANRVLWAGVDAPVYDLDGVTPLAGGGYLAQLYAGPSADALSATGEPQAFSEDQRAGYVPAQSVLIPSVAPGRLAVVQVRAWDASAGSSYEEALAAGGKVGASQVVEVVTGGAGMPPTLPSPLSGLQSFHLILPPQFMPMAPWGIPELVAMTVRPSLLDAGLPPREWVFISGPDNPPGVQVDAATGELTWTPSEIEGPGVYPLTVVAVDSVVPGVEGRVTFEVTVAEVNTPPALDPAAVSIEEGKLVSLDLVASDGDMPPNKLRYELVEGPLGLEVNAETGQITWMTGELDGPEVHAVRVRVVDDGVPALGAEEILTVSVTEVNSAPILFEWALQSGQEETEWTVQLSAEDGDVPANTLTYGVVGEVPEGLAVDSVTGRLTWTPSEEQGPGAYEITVQVTDDGVPMEAAERTVVLQVSEVNEAPHLQVPETVDSDEKVLLTFVVTTDDADDVPANSVQLSAIGLPEGSTFDSETGVFAWTPEEWQQGVYQVAFEAIDDGEPAMQSRQDVLLTIREVNDAPTVAAMADQVMVQDGSLGPLAILIDDVDTPIEDLVVRVTGADDALVPPEGFVVTGVGSTRSLTVIPAEGRWGTTTVRIEVSDGSVSATEEFLLSVLQSVSHFGTVFDGYVMQAKVFLDGDRDRVHDEGEPWGMTDAQGHFTVHYVLDQFDLDHDGLLEASEARWVAEGGRDLATGQVLSIPLEALPSAQVITPLTTLIARVWDAEPERGETEAKQKVMQALGLPEGVDPEEYDVLAQAELGDPVSVTLMQAAAMLQDTAVQIAAVLDALQPPGSLSSGSAVVQVLSTAVTEGSGLALDSPGGVEAVLEAASALVGLSVLPELKQGVAQVVAELNAAKVVAAEQAVDTLAAAKAITRVQVVAQAMVVGALRTAAVHEALIEDTIIAFSGESLGDQVAAAPVGDLTGTDTRPGQFEWSQASYTVREDGTASLPVTLVRRNGSSSEVRLRVEVEESGSAGSEDFLASSMDVVFADGAIVATLDVGALLWDDAEGEGAEQFSLRVELAEGSPEEAALGVLTQTEIQVVDNDTPGRFEFSADEYVVREDGVAARPVTLVRSEGSGGEVRLRVHLEPLEGEALPDIDFQASPLDIVFSSGNLQRRVILPLIEEAVHEDDEWLGLRLELVSAEGLGAEVGARATATVLVEDNDPPRAPLWVTPTWMGSGEFVIKGQGDAGHEYRVEWTEDFEIWHDSGVEQADALGWWENRVAVGEAGPQRFYRAREP